MKNDANKVIIKDIDRETTGYILNELNEQEVQDLDYKFI
jgi:hypothetical protein